MRRLKRSGHLPADVETKLAAETAKIVGSANPKAEALRLFNNARKTVWFNPVVEALEQLSGPGQRCMFCSGSEASDVEHFRPKAVFPNLAMTWGNYLWSCTPCNRGKLSRFPPKTGPGGRYVNPLKENVWKFFFIDDFGFLTPNYDVGIAALNPRAVTTRDHLDLNREALQETRFARLRDLKGQVRDTLKLLSLQQLSKSAAKKKIKEWRAQPFQPDVADYFLNGPGKTKSPFKELFAAL